MSETIYWLVGYWIEILKMYFIMTYIFRCRMRSRMEFVIVAFSAIILLLPGVIPNKTYISGCVVGITMITVFIMLKKKREVILAILGFTIICIIDMGISGMIGSLLNLRADEILEDYLMSTFLNMQSLIPLMLLIRFLKKKKSFSSYFYSEKSLKRIFVITISLFLAILLFVPFQLLSLNTNNQPHKVSLLALTIDLFLFVGIATAYVVVMMKNEQKEKDNLVYQHLLKKQQQLYRNLLEHENETRRFRHDVHHHMNCINEYLNRNQVESAKGYIDSMYGFVKHSYFISTGNFCLDIVLNDVWKEYRGKIDMSWNGMFPPDTILSDIDLCILFSNLFKNALEATVESEKSNEICATTKVLGDNLWFVLTNPYKKINRNAKGKFQSTKSVNRGDGIINIQEVIHKYGGIIEFRIEELFTVEIVLVNIIK